jgi:peptide/nickel transport system substrate-binding protein
MDMARQTVTVSQDWLMAKVGPVVLAVLSHFAVVCDAGSAEVPKDGGALRFGIFRDISTLNPFVGTRSIEHYVRTLIYESVTADKEKGVLPRLATSWEISKDSRDYTFHLRRGVRFHPPVSREMTAEDIKWSIEHTLDPKSGGYGRPDLEIIESVQVLDPHRLRVTLKRPSAAFLATLGSLQSFPVVPKGSLKPGEKPSRFPSGTGPYIMQEWQPGQEIRLQKFPSYWERGLPHIDTLILRPINDNDVRFTSVRTGDLDLAERVPPQYVERIRKGEMGDLRVTFAEYGGQRSLIFNVQKAPFDNVKLRQAIAYAIDKEEILRGAHWGIGKIVNQKMAPGSPWYFPIPERQRNNEKAKALLREAGYPGGLKFRMESSRLGTEELPVIKAQFKEAGIEMDFELMDSISYINRLRDGQFGFGTTGGDFSFDPDGTYYAYFHTDRSPEKVNHSNYSNPKVDRLLELGRTEMNPKKRMEIYRQAVEIIHDEVPVIHLFVTSYAFAYRPHVKGLVMDPQSHYYSLGTGIPHAWIDK